MKNIVFLNAAIVIGLLFSSKMTFAQSPDLRVVLLRHAEKPKKGDDLSCQGINRSILLVPVLHSRFGTPSAIYVPSVGGKGKHARMQQTISPFADKYNVAVNSDFGVDDIKPLAQAIRKEKGTVFVVWEHNGIPAIARRLGVKGASLDWSGDDFDSLWIVQYVNGAAVIKKDKEGLHPKKNCPN
ncbi:MAG: histidine phosphatase family protein [Bacteroidetes bacterium]|nr:histidine phosphatase family protein [Bacteroidota bacterium]